MKFHQILRTHWYTQDFLSLDTALGHVWPWWQVVGVAHKLLKKKKKKITIQIPDKATSVKTIYKQSSGTGIPSHAPAQS